MSSTPDIWQFDPYEFEVFVAKLWEDNGYETKVRQKSNDKGIDIEARKDDKVELIQVKQYNPENRIGSNDVRKYATLYQQVPDVDDVIIVTSSTFTSPARELGNDLGVRLIDGQALEEMTKKAGFDLDNISVEVESPNRTDAFIKVMLALGGGLVIVFIFLVFLMFLGWFWIATCC